MLFAVNALAMSTMPGMLVVGMLRPLGVPLVLGLVSTLLLFPPIALSMAGNDSLFAPYSATVFGSFKRHRQSWTRFYGKVILIAMLLVGIDFAVWVVMSAINARAAAASGWREMISQVITITSVCLYAVLFCRLLGRMAYILARDEPDEDEEEGEREAGPALQARTAAANDTASGHRDVGAETRAATTSGYSAQQWWAGHQVPPRATLMLLRNTGKQATRVIWPSDQLDEFFANRWAGGDDAA
jgi:hypothetical protein